MNETAGLQTQEAQWLEVILVWLGILIPIQTGPIISFILHYSRSTPEILINSFAVLLLLTISIGLILKHQTLSFWFLKTPNSKQNTSTQDSELLRWLAMGLVTFGLFSLIPMIPSILIGISSKLSLWFKLSSNQEALDRIWFDLAWSWLHSVPQITAALLLIFFPQLLAEWALSLQKRWGSLERETLR